MYITCLYSTVCTAIIVHWYYLLVYAASNTQMVKLKSICWLSFKSTPIKLHCVFYDYESHRKRDVNKNINHVTVHQQQTIKTQNYNVEVNIKRYSWRLFIIPDCLSFFLINNVKHYTEKHITRI